MKGFVEEIENEVIPALEIIHKSLGVLDDSHGQALLLSGVIDRLRKQIQTAINN